MSTESIMGLKYHKPRLTKEKEWLIFFFFFHLQLLKQHFSGQLEFPVSTGQPSPCKIALSCRPWDSQSNPEEQVMQSCTVGWHRAGWVAETSSASVPWSWRGLILLSVLAEVTPPLCSALLNWATKNEVVLLWLSIIFVQLLGQSDTARLGERGIKDLRWSWSYCKQETGVS